MECVYKSKDGVCLKLSTDTFTDYCVEGPCPYETLSNGDKFRTMTDEELAERLLKIAYAEFDGVEIASLWCEGKTVGENGEVECVDCNHEQHKACVLRWLRSPAKEEVL